MAFIRLGLYIYIYGRLGCGAGEDAIRSSRYLYQKGYSLTLFERLFTTEGSVGYTNFGRP